MVKIGEKIKILNIEDEERAKEIETGRVGLVNFKRKDPVHGRLIWVKFDDETQFCLREEDKYRVVS